MKIDVLAIGELLADFISNDYTDSLANTHEFTMFQGGSPANLCANLKFLGKNAELVATVGADNIGTFLIQSLQKIGLGSTYIHQIHGIPTSLVLVGKSLNSPDFIAYRMADTHIEPIPGTLLLNAKIVHTSAFALSKNPAQQHILQALNIAKSLGNQVSCDWNFAPEIWSPSTGQNIFEELCALHPLLKLSLDDFRRFTNNPTATAEQAISYLSQFHTTLTCLTCGSEGVWYTDHEKSWHKQDAKPVSVVDATGAGDAFWAGFLAEFSQSNNIHASVSNGINLAAQKIQQLGPLYL